MGKMALEQLTWKYMIYNHDTSRAGSSVHGHWCQLNIPFTHVVACKRQTCSHVPDMDFAERNGIYSASKNFTFSGMMVTQLYIFYFTGHISGHNVSPTSFLYTDEEKHIFAQRGENWCFSN